MVLLSSTVFAVNKGGCGKTTLAFQLSTTLAKQAPDTDGVLVIDLSLMGDLSVMLLGGASQKCKEVNLEGWYRGVDHGKCTTAMIAGAGTFSSADTLPRASGGGVFSAITGDLALRQPNFDGDQVKDAAAAKAGFPLWDYAVRASDVNPRVPPNLYVIPTARTVGHNTLTNEAVAHISRVIVGALEAHPEARLHLICDTDGDTQVIGPYTKLGYALCRNIVSPLEVSPIDFQRLFLTMENVNQLCLLDPKSGPYHCRWKFLIFTKVTAVNQQWGAHKLTSPQKNAEKGVMEEIVRDVYGLNKQLPDIFSLGRSSDGDAGTSADTEEAIERFKEGIFGIFRSTETPMFVSQTSGIPICTMKKADHKSLNEEALKNVRVNLEELVRLVFSVGPAQ